MKNTLLATLFALSCMLVKAQQGCTIQANCKQVITLSPAGFDSVLIYGLAVASDGIKSYIWSQKSGPSPSLPAVTNASQLYVKNLVPGTYIYGFGATTNSGTILAPIPDTLIVQAFVDKIDSIRIYYRSGKVASQQ